MSRIRTIKPDFWGSPKVAKISRDARLLFLGLLNESDDEGRQLGSPRRIAGTVFPHDDDVSTGHVRRWLDELDDAGMIDRYDVDGGAYVLICGFTEHQKVSHPTPSRLPAPPEKSSESLTNSSGESPEVLGPDLGSGSRNLDLGSGSIAPDEPARDRDLLWDAVMDACGVDCSSITTSARGAYNKAAKDLRDAGAEPGDVGRRAAVYRMRWPDTALTPNALARHWAELEPNGHNVPGRVVPKGIAALARVAAKGDES